MKTKNTILALVLFIISLNSFSQQIGTGHATNITDFSVPLTSGVYNGLNAAGRTPDDSYFGWQHLFVSRHSNSANNFQLQLASSFTKNDRLFFRKIEDNTVGSGSGWFELATRGANVFNGNQSILGNFEIYKLNSNLSFDVNTNSLCKIISRGWNASIDMHTFQINGTENLNQLYLSTNGNVGIGTITPLSKLDVYSETDLGIRYSGIRTHRPGAFGQFAFMDYNYMGDISIFGSSYTGGAGQYGKILFRQYGQNNQFIDAMFLDNTGNVGIGTTSPDAKLTVKGRIHTQEVKVDLLGALVPDYVFAKDYKLKSLEEVDSYIKANSHLPEIPSATEIEKNGLLLAEMNMSLLKKIEELTLYAIEQQKKLEALETRLKQLEK